MTTAGTDMRFRFCPDCGAPLSERDLGDDKNIPWCGVCGKPWFPLFATCVITLVHNSRGEVLLLHQNYISTRYANLVSGYMQPGETAEIAAAREVEEETGIKIKSLRYAGTYWFGKKQMLMIGFIAEAGDDAHIAISSEVDSAGWYPAAQAVAMVHPAGSVSHTLCDIYLGSITG